MRTQIHNLEILLYLYVLSINQKSKKKKISTNSHNKTRTFYLKHIISKLYFFTTLNYSDS